MIRRHAATLFVMLGLATCLQAQGATISLSPSSALVTQSQSFTLDLLLSAADAPGNHPGAMSGEVIISYDPTLVSYQAGSLSLGSGVSLYLPLSVGSDNGLQTLTFGFQDAADVGSVATLAFTALGAAGSTINFGLADNDDFAGSFINADPTNQRFYPGITGTSVQVVPLPGGAWLALTAFAALAGRVRRSSRRG